MIDERKLFFVGVIRKAKFADATGQCGVNVRLVTAIENLELLKVGQDGNRRLGSKVRVSNPVRISYPGYSEILTGRVDPRVFDNHPWRDRSTNFLQFLSKQVPFAGKTAAFASWSNLYFALGCLIIYLFVVVSAYFLFIFLIGKNAVCEKTPRSSITPTLPIRRLKRTPV